MAQENFTQKEYKEASKGAMKQTRLKMKKGFMAAPLFYKVLMVHQLSEPQKKEVFKGLCFATTSEKAKSLAGKNGWGWRDALPLGAMFEVGLLQYKGLGVALFYKRQVNTIEPEVFDPVPVGALESDEDVWVRIDLFSKSPRQLTQAMQKEFVELDMKNFDLQNELAATKVLLDAQIKTNKGLQTQITQLKKLVPKSKQKTK